MFIQIKQTGVHLFISFSETDNLSLKTIKQFVSGLIRDCFQHMLSCQCTSARFLINNDVYEKILEYLVVESC